jgi:hypothetical protein
MTVEVIDLDVALAAVEAQTFVTSEGRRLHHCFLGGMGADWDETDVVALCRRADTLLWSDTVLGRILMIEANGKVYAFDTVQAPKVDP